MKEPVLLPTSGTICDAKTIRKHLLNDEHDPFNRMPLKITDLKEVPELKARVLRWIQQKLAGEVTDEEKNARGENEEMKQEDSELKEEDYSPEFFDDDQLQRMKKDHGLQMTMSQIPSGNTYKYDGDGDVQM